MLLLSIILYDNKLVSFLVVPKTLDKMCVKLLVTNRLAVPNVMKVNTIKLTDYQELLNIIVRELTLGDYGLV